MSRGGHFHPVGHPANTAARQVGWVDVHNHLLPGLDDGPRDDAAAIDLCRAMADQGVTHAAATPHLFGPYAHTDRIERILEAAARLAEQVASLGIPLTLYHGADIRIDALLARELAQGGVLALGRGGQHLLLEPPHDVWIDAPAVCRTVEDAGCVPVLTHPERHQHLHREGPGPLQAWVDAGAVLQVTAGSLLGDFGPLAEELGWGIVASPIPAIIASDAHDTRRRPPRIGDAAAEVERRLGRDAALRLCRDLPWSFLVDTRPVLSPGKGRAERAAAE